METVADDYSAFCGQEHMFFGLCTPFATIRAGTEAMLRSQATETIVDAIVTKGEPKFLTLGPERTRWFRKGIRLTHFAFCVRVTLHVRTSSSAPRQAMEAVLTFMFGHVDQPGQETSSRFLDLEPDLTRAFSYDLFRERFLAFRRESDSTTDGLPRDPSNDTGHRVNRFRYLPRLRPALVGLVFFGAAAVLLTHRAILNERGVVLNGIVELGPTGATVFYAALAAFSWAFVLSCLGDCAARFRAPQFVTLDDEAITIPSIWTGRGRRIPYATVRTLSELHGRSQRFLQISHMAGKHYIAARMLESDAAFASLSRALKSRVARRGGV